MVHCNRPALLGIHGKVPAHGCCRWSTEMWGHWQQRARPVRAGSCRDRVYPLVQAQAPSHIPLIFPVGQRVHVTAWLVTLVHCTLYHYTCSSLAPNMCLLSPHGWTRNLTSVRSAGFDGRALAVTKRQKGKTRTPGIHSLIHTVSHAWSSLTQSHFVLSLRSVKKNQPERSRM